MKKILVPTDFSDNARLALDYAIDLADQFDAQLTLLHCYRVITSTGSFISMERYLKEDAERDMTALVEEVKGQKKDMEIDYEIRRGDAVLLASDIADRSNYDLIVMGTQGASGLKSILMGSTARGLLERAKTPMLVIPKNCTYKPIKKIVFATDDLHFSLMDEVHSLFKLAQKLVAKVLILHVKERGTDVNVDPRSEDLLKGVDHKYHIIERTDKGIDESIETFAEKYEADMICMIKQERGFWGKLFHASLTEKELIHTTLPLLLLKEIEDSTA